jgi:hypothetical protein
MAKDNAVHLPVWLKYYKKYFAPQNIYVLDHETKDGSTSGLDVPVIPIHNQAYNAQQWIMDTTKQWQVKLLKQYQYVLHAHPDEMIVADPDKYPGGLAEYITKNVLPAVVRCDGRGVVQNLVLEKGDMDWSRPIFEQRRWWYRDIHDCKPYLANRPLDWAWGFHWENGKTDQLIDPDLMLIHLHRADLKAMLDRHAWMRKQRFHDNGDRGEAGAHHQWSDDAVMKDMAEWQGRMESIPERFNGSIL